MRLAVPTLTVALATLSASCVEGVSVGSVPLEPKPPERRPLARHIAKPSHIPTDYSEVERARAGVPVYIDDLVAGAAHACARAYTGAVYCWGSNAEGQLGRGADRFATTPGATRSNTIAHRIFAGPTQTAILDDDGQIGHWGLYAPRNDDGVTPWSNHDTPGVDALVGVTFGERFALAWARNGTLIGWGAPDRASFTTAFVVKPVVIHLGAQVSQVSVWSRDGDGHGCLVVRDGGVRCWGRNDRGQLGRGAMEWGVFQLPRVSEVARVTVGERFSCALRGDASVWCWGANDAGQLGAATTYDSDVPARVGVEGEVLDVATGARHACALTRDGVVWCWGSNSAGQLGTSSVELLASAPVRVRGLPKATGIAVGDDFSCARTEDARAFCWGNNDRGQLGDGTTVRRAEARPVRL